MCARMAASSALCRSNSLRSSPAQKARPAPVEHDGRVCSSPRPRSSAACEGGEQVAADAFSRSGRFSVTRPIGPRRSYKAKLIGHFLTIQLVLPAVRGRLSGGQEHHARPQRRHAGVWRPLARAPRPPIAPGRDSAPPPRPQSRSGRRDRARAAGCRNWPEQRSGRLEQTVLHCGREDVDAAHVEHVVGAAGDPEAPGRAAAGARAPARDGDQVARAIAEQRLAFLGKMGADQLARAALPDRLTVARRVEDLDEQRVGAVEMQIGGPFALAGEVAQHLRHAVIGVADAKAPRDLQILPELRIVSPASPPNRPSLRPRSSGRRLALRRTFSRSAG